MRKEVERKKYCSIHLLFQFFEMLLGKFNFFPYSKIKKIFESAEYFLYRVPVSCYSELYTLLLLNPLEYQGFHMCSF